ncbi:dTMP kinase [Streptomyces sparsogenes]|uniref:Thymidylate kinase n=1 Tax=Streptomyces sparsogenes DSM 40356 TaxID=1331668 RepID=A0A1R1S5V4_9ACTN|nr:dTMP kinase [Streptomyces sparsogenes]OMI33552.1 thymidylate kinase [Streptomyces sparsogenes DSM 40356]
MTGMFVTIDGPGGVGKSTVTAAVVSQLRAAGLPVHQTREPSDTTLGQLARHGTEDYRGMTMACLIAADRYSHLEREIRPAVARGDAVVCDRYIASSLVLQVLDGVGRDFVWELNRQADMPDLAVILNARADVITKRLGRRGAHSRYEREPGGTEQECALYLEAARFLMASGVRVLQLDASTAGPDDIARAIVAAIREPWMRGRL